MPETSIIYALYRTDETRHTLTKVGSTRISADSRAANYTDGEWVKYFDVEVSSHIQFAVERTTHNILRNQGYWLDPKVNNGTAQEIFTCEPEEAQKAIIQAIEQVTSDLARYIYADEFSKTDRLLREIARLRDDKLLLEGRLQTEFARRGKGKVFEDLKASKTELLEQLAASQKTIRSLQFRINQLESYVEETGGDLSRIWR